MVKRLFSNFLIFLMFVILLQTFVFATNRNAGTSGAQFLKLGIDSRAIGMGEAYTGVVTDVSSIYWNPGGLAFLKSKELIAQHTKYFQDVNQEYAAFACPVTETVNVGVSMTYLYLEKDMEARTGDTDNPSGYYSANDNAVSVSASKLIRDNLGVGVNVKYIESKLEVVSANTYAMDAGVSYLPMDKLRVGFAIQNFGEKIKFISQEDNLPLTYRMGAGYVMLKDKLTLSLDAVSPNDNYDYFCFGGEYKIKFDNKFSMPLRVGYKTLNDFDFIDGIRAGIGFDYPKYGSLDFAWTPYGDLGNIFRVSMTIKFN